MKFDKTSFWLDDSDQEQLIRRPFAKEWFLDKLERLDRIELYKTFKKVNHL